MIINKELMMYYIYFQNNEKVMKQLQIILDRKVTKNLTSLPSGLKVIPIVSNIKMYENVL